ncbi:MAG: mechanosensitive ion channel family protein [Candidatus Heimdallarchaeota archaeon]|nr:mechanosensitive ion channel family protein [Candidatus Heimdallarchaeota archaeon]MDH5646416.1 mechanosensitive ion channel family protein [Candidatus Heimdallarchaeota archaeon]
MVEFPVSILKEIIITFIIGIVLSSIVSLIIMPWLQKATARKQKRNIRILIKSISGLVFFWVNAFVFYIYLSYFAPHNELFSNIKFGLQIILLLSLLFGIQQAINNFITYSLRKKRLPKTTIYSNIIRILVFFTLLFILMRLLNINVEPLIATLGIGALAIALALQDTLSNLFAGIYIIAVKQINTGDYIRLQSGEEGYIEDINWRNTTIRSLQNNLIILPNSFLGTNIITNFSLPKREMNIKLAIGVSYDADLEFVEKITIDVANQVIKEFNIEVDFEPRVRYFEFGDFAIKFHLSVRIKEFEQQFIIIHTLIKRIHQRYKQEHIEIPFPIRTIINKRDN